MLNEEQETRAPDEAPPEHTPRPPSPDALVSPTPGHALPDDQTPQDAPPLSPIRPTISDEAEPQPPLTPTLPDDSKPTDELTPREQMQRAEEALINLRQKMARVAAEFAEGKLNPDQFDAIYGRYSEQRDITERLLARDPESRAWKSVVQSGHTQFLRSHYEARVISYAIYAQENAELIGVTGQYRIKSAQIEAVLGRLKIVLETRGNPGSAQRRLQDGRHVLFAPGDLTVAVVIFSREPAPVQVERIEDLHQDFERANLRALRLRDYDASRMVFPHRALFEGQE